MAMVPYHELLRNERERQVPSYSVFDEIKILVLCRPEYLSDQTLLNLFNALSFAVHLLLTGFTSNLQYFCSFTVLETGSP